MQLPTLTAFALFLLAALPLSAQQTLDAPPPSSVVAVHHDSGAVANTGGLPQVVISFPVKVDAAPWMRLYFSRIELAGDRDQGNASILRLTSVLDAEVQELDLEGTRRWSSTSAYFNGDMVLVEVLAYPGTGANRVVLDHVVAGKAFIGTDAACGTDLRIASTDGRTARLLPPGCTAWLIDDCQTCLLSAGHCMAGGMVAQFNVPQSLPNGSLVNPPVEDQFPIDPVSVQGQNSGPGGDWAYLGAFDNNLGQSPFEHQLARWGTSATPPFSSSDVIRVTGCGIDLGTANQTQQTVTGTWTGLATNHFTYNTYVEPGNSGSPAIHEATGIAIGIVTHTSCPSPFVQQNYATRLTQPNLLNARANPRGVCAVTACNAVGASYCTFGPSMSVIAASGSASVAANDLVLHVNNVPVNHNGICFYSRHKQSLPFGVSRLCVGGGGFPILRLPGLNSGAGTTFTFPLDLGALPSGDVIGAGETIYFQSWFRTGPGTTETSNGLEVTYGP